TVVMGVAKIQSMTTTSTVAAVAPAKTVRVVSQVPTTSSAICKSIQMVLPLLWFVL
ncbi:hypothetical protein BCR33DRAFT_714247, partial [Rhizoclosmatium globosum]